MERHENFHQIVGLFCHSHAIQKGFLDGLSVAFEPQTFKVCFQFPSGGVDGLVGALVVDAGELSSLKRDAPLYGTTHFHGHGGDQLFSAGIVQPEQHLHRHVHGKVHGSIQEFFNGQLHLEKTLGGGHSDRDEVLWWNRFELYVEWDDTIARFHGGGDGFKPIHSPLHFVNFPDGHGLFFFKNRDALSDGRDAFVGFDLREFHAKVFEADNHVELFILLQAVVTVAGPGVSLARGEEADLVVVDEGLAGDVVESSHLSDGEGNFHGGNPASGLWGGAAFVLTLYLLYTLLLIGSLTLFGRLRRKL